MFNKKLKKLCNLIAIGLLLPAFAYSQQTRSLGLPEAILMARNHSSQLRADSVQTAIAQTHVSQVKAAALPQVALSATFQRMSDNITPFAISFPTGSFVINPQILNQSHNSVELTQLLYGGGRMKNNRLSLSREAQATAFDYSRSVLTIEQKVTDLWFNLYNANQSRRIVEENIKALGGRRSDLEKFRIQGIVLENDVLKLDLQITGLRSNLSELNSVVGTLNYNLCILTGIDPSVSILTPDQALKQTHQIQPLSVYIDAALQGRPEINSIKLRTESAGFRIKTAKADYLPTLSLIGSFAYDSPNQRVIPNVSRYDYTALGGLNLSWKISSLYANRSKVAESRLTVLQFKHNTQNLRENIQQEVNSLYLSAIKTIEKLALVQTELEQATENYRVEGNKLNAQTTTPTDFLTANSQLLQAQLNLATAKANAELAYRKLIQSTGVSAN